MSDTLSLGTRPDTYATASEFCTGVRGGGAAGGRSYVARIVGIGGPYGIDRKFVNKRSHTSRSGASGAVSWEVTEDGVYELARFAADSKREATVFILRSGSQVVIVEKAEVQEFFTWNPDMQETLLRLVADGMGYADAVEASAWLAD